MDIKLSALFLLIAAILGLSHLNRGNLTRMKREYGRQRKSGVVPRRRRS
jgi:hypothetical protein